MILCGYSCYLYTDTQYHSKKILLEHFEGAKTTKYSYFGENTGFPYISVQNQCKFPSVTISIKDLTN